MAASVNTRVVSWNDAAEMNESVESEALVMPSRSGVPSAGAHALALLHVDVHGAGNAVLVARALVGLDDDAAQALHDRAVMHRTVDLGDDGLLARVARFEQLDDARKTTGDVLRLRGRAGNL